ncbi:AraC family transcriptional regulator [Xanthocytophaga agilis]|uniref:AraC family transcriptional regulator n=1 Tax=Xanthocytophaga agilis TaxID=3048010 RepID=A0AAE3R120_9BACT|nr:AraC family transcriptional regulator [Xanthocytophaga agilis]MDJ1499480.1 AraC family transcriptional regulator [Xanthocytophaga agilis]
MQLNHNDSYHFGVPVEQSGNFELMQVMQANISTNITLSKLVFLCHMSLSTFKRIFEQVYHMAPNKWLLDRKMEMAANLLRRKKSKPSEVSLEIGYENHSSFSKAFRRIYGITPKEYQDQL